jgi:hypothetical protein
VARSQEHVIALADVSFPEGGQAARLVARYRAWLGLDTAPGAPNPASHASPTPAGADGDIDLSRPIELVVLSIEERAAWCRLLGTEKTITLRSSGLWKVVPGEIITIRPPKAWRYAGHPYLSGDIEGMRLDVAALGLVPLRLEPCGTWDPAEEYYGEEGDAIDDWAQTIITHLLSAQSSVSAHPARPPADQTVEGRQLDLFVDGRDALLVHEIVTGLIGRDVGRTGTGLHRLGQEHPHHPDLAALTVLAEALTASAPAAGTHEALSERIDLIERRLVPAAHRFLGADADAFLRPTWQMLAVTATDLPFDAAHPRAHRGWICQQYGEWADVRTAVEHEPAWADTPLLRYWMGLAQQHLGAPEVAIRLWLPLCWMDPLLFETHAPTVPHSTIRTAWIAFEQASPFEESLADRAPAAVWFPAWLLLRHRGLSRLFDPDDVRDAGSAARVFRHLLKLLPLEQRGLTDELIGQRRALRQLDASFFRYYMAVLGERRSSS